MSKLEGLRWRVVTLWGRAMLRSKGVQVGSGVKLDGLPIVSGAKLGKIAIGDRVSLVSRSSGTALGVRSRTILRLLAPGARLAIGSDCGLSGAVICAAIGVELGERCLIGADVLIFDTDFHNRGHDRRYSVPDWQSISRPVVIEENVFIGARSIVTKGVRIGKGAIIGAGSIVVSDVPPSTVFAGNPARLIGRV